MYSSFDLPVFPSHEPQLSPERKTAIEHALQKYRKRVLELNVHALEIAIKDMEEQQQLQPEETLECLNDNYGVRLNPPDPGVTTASDFLSEDRRDTLTRTCRLDGVRHGDFDLAGRYEWIKTTERNISTDERIVDEVRSVGLPPELKYLMTLVRGLCGPGLPRYRFDGELRQLKFLSGLNDGDSEEDELKTDSGVVTVPQTPEGVLRGEAGDGILEDWGGTHYKVGLAVSIGDGGFAVYCRDREDENDEYRWRYGLMDPKDAMESDLYDTIEDFLDFYAEFNKQSEEEDNILM